MMDRTPVPQHLASAAPAGITERQASYLRGLANERDIPEEARADIIARLDRVTPEWPNGEITKQRASEWISRLVKKDKLPQQLPARGGPTRDRMGEARGLLDTGEAGRFPVNFKMVELDGGKTRRLGFVTVDGIKVPQGKYALDTSANDSFKNDITFFNLFTSNDRDSGAPFYSIKMFVSDDLVKFGAPLQREVLKRIATDPAAASGLYGKHKKRCGICNRKLTNDVSRERGIGPVCASRMEW